MKVVCVGYRKWSLEIYKNLSKDKKISFYLIKNKKDLTLKKILDINPDFCLFYGWSWKISNKIIKKFRCIMLHPSKLPKFRGGSPIQNQIIRGITKSSVTHFIMNEKLDCGEIIFQDDLDLSVSLDEIFNQIIKISIMRTKLILRNKYTSKPQDNLNSSYFKRISPNNSEISIDEIKNKSGKYLFNKIRMLQDPYPNPYILTSDGHKLVIKTVKLLK